MYHPHVILSGVVPSECFLTVSDFARQSLSLVDDFFVHAQIPFSDEAFSTLITLDFAHFFMWKHVFAPWPWQHFPFGFPVLGPFLQWNTCEHLLTWPLLLWMEPFPVL